MRRLSFLPTAPVQQGGSDGGNRRDEMHDFPAQPRRAQPRRRTTVTRGGLSDLDHHGLLGSLRRFSLDSPTDLRHHQDCIEDDYNTVSDYQEVFHKMKLEYPTASIGALQQRTIERITELKAIRKAQLRREREIREKKEEEERIRNQSVAEKYVHRLVGKILPNPLHHLDSVHEQHPQDNNNSSSSLTHLYPPPSYHLTTTLQDERLDAHVADPITTTPTTVHASEKSFHMVPTGAHLSMVHNNLTDAMNTQNNATSAANTKNNTRRPSSALIMDIPPWTNVRRRSSAENSSNTNENSNDAMTNLAPRKSVNDMSVLANEGRDKSGRDRKSITGFVDDGSIQSFHSNGTGLVSNTSENYTPCSDKSGSELYYSDDPHPPFISSNEEPKNTEYVLTQMLISYPASTRSTTHAVVNNGVDDRIVVSNTIAAGISKNEGGSSVQHSSSSSAIMSSSENDFPNTTNTNTHRSNREMKQQQHSSSVLDKSSSSLSSTYESKTSYSEEGDGLIVGFGNRYRRNSDSATVTSTGTTIVEDELIVGFVDRRASFV